MPSLFCADSWRATVWFLALWNGCGTFLGEHDEALSEAEDPSEVAVSEPPRQGRSIRDASLYGAALEAQTTTSGPC